MSKHSKAYRAVAEKIDRSVLYTPLQAMEFVKESASTKYDSTVDVAVRLGVDPRQADQMVRGTVNLPNGTGKSARVLVFATGANADAARDAGADHVGADELVEKVNEGWLDFDAVVATPDMMGKVGRLGRVLGPRNLMPNPKTGTVTMDVAKAVRDAKAGKLEYRTDRGANVHVAIGKKSFGERQLVENYAALVDEIVRAKPAAAKGRYIRGITLTSTMGPGIKVDPARTRGIVDDLEEQAETVNA
jgi:large subunit ribosomal protein L1